MSPRRGNGPRPREVVPQQVRVVRVDDLDADRRSVVTAGMGEPRVGEVAVLGDPPIGREDEMHAEFAAFNDRDGSRGRASFELK